MSAMLRECGFEVKLAVLFKRPTPLPHGIRAWLKTFGSALFDRLPSEADRIAALDEAACAWEAQAANSVETTPGGAAAWTLDYVRLRFVAVKPG